MARYLVVIKNCYVRDTQVADNEYIRRLEEGMDIPDDSNWRDMSKGDGAYVMGTVTTSNEQSAKECASEIYGIDVRAFETYELGEE